MIGIAGKMGTGKDFYCQQIVDQLRSQGYRTLILSFADQIKVNVATRAGVPIRDMFDNKTPEIRRLLQKEGTDVGRDQLSQDIWIKYLENIIELHKYRGQLDIVVIPDCRFRNEVNWIKDNGGMVVQLSAPDRNLSRLQRESGGDQSMFDAISGHRSETSLDDYDDFDLRIDNSLGREGDLESNVENIILHLHHLMKRRQQLPQRQHN
jgi:phosphomevalonate kinase